MIMAPSGTSETLSYHNFQILHYTISNNLPSKHKLQRLHIIQISEVIRELEIKLVFHTFHFLTLQAIC